MLALRQPSATRVLMLKTGGARCPDLCCPEVLTSLFLPQNGQIITQAVRPRVKFSVAFSFLFFSFLFFFFFVPR